MSSLSASTGAFQNFARSRISRSFKSVSWHCETFARSSNMSSECVACNSSALLSCSCCHFFDGRGRRSVCCSSKGASNPACKLAHLPLLQRSFPLSPILSVVVGLGRASADTSRTYLAPCYQFHLNTLLRLRAHLRREHLVVFFGVVLHFVSEFLTRPRQ